jgi:outer membrane protein TolC
MKISILFLFAITLQLTGFCQQADTLKIEDCFRMATLESPLQRQKVITGEALSYKIKNLNTNWFPTIGLNAQATYNSETIDFSAITEGLPVSISSPPLDQYKVWADINQQLYDGGMIKAQKAIEKASYEAGIQQVETDLHSIKQQVSQVYFSLLLTKKSSAILQVTLDELQERKKVIHTGVDNGVVLPENLLSLEAEELKLQQNLTELRLMQGQLFKVLSILMDTTLTENTEIAEPIEPGGFNDPVNRSEYLVFEKQKEVYKANQKLVSASDLPKLFAFSQAAYGRPGYDMLSSDFHAFYSVGLGMKWNLINYGDSRRQKKIFDIQKDIVDIKRETFDDQLNIQLQTENTNIEKYIELLGQDEQILKLRKAITATSLSKLNNGIITATDYLAELNAEVLAMLQYENHRVLKLQAAYNYLLLKGIL